MRRAGRAAAAPSSGSAASISGNGDHETLEIVVLVRAVHGIVMRRSGGQIVLGGGGQAEQHRRVEPAFTRRHQFHRPRHRAADLAAQPRQIVASSSRSVLFSTTRSADCN